MLIENIETVKSKYPHFWNELQSNKNSFQPTLIETESAKNGAVTLYATRENRKVYFHSKYNPQEEANVFTNKYENADEYDHIFFYGLGMGYHVEAMLAKYPNKAYTIYEPDPTIFMKYLENRLLRDLPLQDLRSLYIQWQPELMGPHLQHFVSNVNGNVMLVIPTSYEGLYKDQVDSFSDMFSNVIYNQRNNLGVNQSFEKRWTVNSMVNFPAVIKSQNIIIEKKQYFEGKPVILVAAGPSFQDEIENLRHIKENKLAYIFAVGSANKGLIKNGIYPDAVTSYDPETGREGLDVFSDITEQNITSIPLIFGSSVGYQAVEKYTGPLLHMFINQDTVSPFYLGTHQTNTSTLSDAPSIAVVTMQLLAMLGCNPVVLVGQNFAYRNNQYYASGIGYAVRPTDLTEHEISNTIQVPGVEGGIVHTNKGFEQARKTMEFYIHNMQNVQVINTTQGGAHIEGAAFKQLDSVIRDSFNAPVVDSSWYEGEKTNYDLRNVQRQSKVIEQELKELQGILNNLLSHFRAMDRYSKLNDAKQLERVFVLFDKSFKELSTNKFYKVFIQPMLRNQQQLLSRNLSEIRNTTDPYQKATKILDVFGRYVYVCQGEVLAVSKPFRALQAAIAPEVKATIHAVKK